MPEGRALAQKLTRKNKSPLRTVCPSTKVFQQHCEHRRPPHAVSRGGFVSPSTKERLFNPRTGLYLHRFVYMSTR